MRTYCAFRCDDNKEILVLPSVTPNQHQKRIGIRVGSLTVWMRSAEALDFAKAVRKAATLDDLDLS